MRRTVAAGVTGVGAAFLGALCCLGPLLFVTVGVGSGIAGGFAPFRPLFGGVMILAFGAGFYTVYGRRVSGNRGADRCKVPCQEPRNRTSDKAVLWISLVLAFVLWTFPTWSVWLV